MGRKSVLTPEQWADIERRHVVEAEPVRKLAREYGISEGAIRARISARAEKTKNVANQIVAAEAAFKELPISAQINAQDLAARLRAVSEHLLSAAGYSSASAHRLSMLANVQLEKVDDVDPLKSLPALTAAATLQKLANVSSEIGLNLLRANKEAVDEANKRKNKAPAGLTHFYGESDDTEPADA